MNQQKESSMNSKINDFIVMYLFADIGREETKDR
jgi:hypothetical protein